MERNRRRNARSTVSTVNAQKCRLHPTCLPARRCSNRRADCTLRLLKATPSAQLPLKEVHDRFTAAGVPQSLQAELGDWITAQAPCSLASGQQRQLLGPLTGEAPASHVPRTLTGLARLSALAAATQKQ